MPPTLNRPKRVAIGVSLPPTLAEALQRESDDRMIAPSLLVEKAVAAYIPTLPPMSNGAAEPPKP